MTFTYIAKQTLISDAASITFSSLAVPQAGNTDLILLCSVRTDRAANGDGLIIQFNGDTGNNYSTTSLSSSGSSATVGTWASVSGIYMSQATTANSDTANTFGSARAHILNFSGGTHKTVIIEGNSETYGTSAGVAADIGIWSNTAVISSILIRPLNGNNLRAESSFYLYGLTRA
jgi:hypothetical protein